MLLLCCYLPMSDTVMLTISRLSPVDVEVGFPRYDNVQVESHAKPSEHGVKSGRASLTNLYKDKVLSLLQ